MRRRHAVARLRIAPARPIGRDLARRSRVPGALVAEIARVTSLGQGIWADARANERVADFLPTLAEILALRREQGQALAEGGQDTYDALLEEYEPYTSAAEIAALFAVLRPRLTALRDDSALPAEPDLAWVNDWLHRAHLAYWARGPQPVRR